MKQWISVLVASGLGALLGCDPAGGLENAEYRPYLDSFERRDLAEVVQAFNQLDTKRGAFDCSGELEAAQRAIWREQAGRLAPERTAEVQAFKVCLERFFAGSGVQQGLIANSVLTPWVNHNFLPAIRTKLDAEVEATQRRLDGAGCAGDPCQALTVIGDLAVTRASLELALAWPEAQQGCAEADLGGLRPWRLPTKAELLALRRSDRLASNTDLTIHWSAERVDEEDGTSKAWVVDFGSPLRVEERGRDAEPALLPLEKRGRPTRARVRCVYDLR